ncbi:MAG: hypothetical protein AAFR01_04120, partial [Pseudomonadota bacterium]
HLEKGKLSRGKMRGGLKLFAKANQGFSFLATAILRDGDTDEMETVAEWVNDDETADFVEQLDVTYIQGFHFGEPVPIRSVIESRQRELSA